MKNVPQLLLLCSMLMYQSCCFRGDCPDDFVEPFQSNYDPVYVSRDVLESSVTLSSSQPIINSGKIYVFADLLFINEKNEGFHVYDNQDPTNPIPLNFIHTLGASDVSIKNGVYYVNQAVDLIAITFDARNSQLRVSKRIRNVFPVMRSPQGEYPTDATEEIICINWNPKTN